MSERPNEQTCATVRELLAEFEDYLAAPERWSTAAMNDYRSRFEAAGVSAWGYLADDIIAHAKEALLGE